MNKSIGIFLLGGVFAAAIVLLLRPSQPAPAPAAPAAVETSSAPASFTSLPATEPTSAATPAIALPATTPATATASTPSAPAATAAPSSTVVTPSGVLTNNPKTLSELYRAFDAINAAAEQTTPESLTSLISFATTENADVRGAALNAIINRDDATAAPLLRKAAKQLDDSKAIIALLETADYIELPSTTMTAIAARPKKPKPAKPNDPLPSPAPATPAPAGQ